MFNHVKRKASFLVILTLVFSVLCACQLPDAWADGHVYHVLVMNFDPTFEMANGIKQHELNSAWNDPRELARGFATDMKEVSHGYASYEISEWIDLDEMPRSEDGFSYDLDEYYRMLMEASAATDGAYWQYSGWEDHGFSFDYDYYLSKYNVYDRVNKGEIDEVWIFAGPVIGVTLYETRMVGRGSYYCNSPALYHDCRPFVVYGFNYEREVAEMLHDAGHRAESIMSQVFGWADYNKDYSDYTDWEKFSAYEKVSPGNAGVGLIHFAPNSQSDYDWNNTRYVESTCSDWENYPFLTGQKTSVNCSTWGNGDQRAYLKWWFKLLPHAKGSNTISGKYNNWWIYFTLDYINNPPSVSPVGPTETSEPAPAIDPSIKGFIEMDGVKMYVEGGAVKNLNGLVPDPDSTDWYYCMNGIVSTDLTQLVEYDDAWFYVVDGKLDTTYTGIVPYNTGLFVVGAGRNMTELQGLIQDPNGSDWYFCANGQVQNQYTGLAMYDENWFYIENGKLADFFTGVVEYDGARFMVADGRLATEAYGLIQDPVSGIWYFCSGGQIQSDYRGLALYDGQWFYVWDGVFQSDAEGWVEHDGAAFYVVNGMVTSN